jgi:hypothetical protein
MHHQSDEEFITTLNTIRENRITANLARMLNDTNAHALPHTTNSAPLITLTARNNTMTTINQNQLTKLPKPTTMLPTKITKNFRTNTNKDPTDRKLHLKPNTQMIFLRNNTTNHKNGPH